MNEDRDEEENPDDEEFMEELGTVFDKNIWPGVKEDCKEMSKKEVARQMFVAGYTSCMKQMDEEMEKAGEEVEKNPEHAD